MLREVITLRNVATPEDVDTQEKWVDLADVDTTLKNVATKRDVITLKDVATPDVIEVELV